MTKIHPNSLTNSSSHSSSDREIFTVWMRSLLFHGNGCTVFNSKGEVVFRVDNYQSRFSSKVFMMDSEGRNLFSLNRKVVYWRLRCFGIWEGFKWVNSKVNKEKPWFNVRRNFSILSKNVSYRVTLGCDGSTGYSCKIVGLKGKSTLKITDFSGQILAEVTEKKSSSGVPLGDDVLTLTVEPQIDQSLIIALVTVYGMMNNKL